MSIGAIQQQLVQEAGCDSIAPLTVLFSCLKDTNISAEVFAHGEENGEMHMVLNCILQ